MWQLSFCCITGTQVQCYWSFVTMMLAVNAACVFMSNQRIQPSCNA